MKLKKSILMIFDKVWCGQTQIPASLLSDVSDNKENLTTLASFRLFLALFLFAELLGFFFITLGFCVDRASWIFLVGLFLKIGGAITGAFFQNKSGSYLSVELQKYLKKLTTHSVEIRSFLSDRGCSDSEINALQTLPTEVYQTELNGYQRSRIINIGAPLFCGVALFINGDLLTSFIVIFLGLASFPIGEKFFKENTHRSESELRLGLSAQLIQYVDKVYKEHLWLTTKVNFLSQLPLLLFAVRFMSNGTGQLLASFFGLTQGLAGLTGTLAFQKARAGSMRTTTTTTHLIHALSSPYLIVTLERWREHCLISAKAPTQSTSEYENAVILKHFSANIPFQEKETVSLSCTIPSGAVCLLQAPSGKGKSTFLSALTHLIEHRGDLFFVSKYNKVDAHLLSRNEFDSKIFFFKEENVDKGARLIDLFKNVTFVEQQHLLKEGHNQFDGLLIDLAWKCPDNLLEQEIKQLELHQHSVFPMQMLDFLKELRKKQILQVHSFLERALGNLGTTRMFPERNFMTLSSGEKRRLVAVLALETCLALKTVCFVILDEPLTHIDKANIDYQLHTINAIQQLPTPPSLLIISHHFIDEMKEKLPNTQEIHFEE